MGKIKTHSATAKRFSLTKGGKVKLSHKLGIKTTKRKRALRKSGILSNSFAPVVKTLLGKN